MFNDGWYGKFEIKDVIGCFGFINVCFYFENFDRILIVFFKIIDKVNYIFMRNCCLNIYFLKWIWYNNKKIYICICY